MICSTNSSSSAFLAWQTLVFLALSSCASPSPQPPPLAPFQKIEVLDQPAHRRVEPVALGQLQGQALGQIARPHPGRLAALHQRQRRLHLLRRGAEAGGNLGQVGAQKSVLVELLDKQARQQQHRRIRPALAKLRQQVRA